MSATITTEVVRAAIAASDGRWVNPEHMVIVITAQFSSYPSGAVGCVSNNYADKKWRIACDPRPFEEQPTFRTRADAARGERDLIASQAAERADDREASMFDRYIAEGIAAIATHPDYDNPVGEDLETAASDTIASILHAVYRKRPWLDCAEEADELLAHAGRAFKGDYEDLRVDSETSATARGC